MLEAVALDQLTLPLELEDFGLLALEFLALAAQLFALAVKTLFLAPGLPPKNVDHFVAQPFTDIQFLIVVLVSSLYVIPLLLPLSIQSEVFNHWFGVGKLG